MRRLLCLFLLIWFPLQMSWAAVASYCQHESNPAAQRHFGHHEHIHLDPQHGERPGDKAAKDKSGGVKKASADNDCTVCHMSAASPVSETHTPEVASSREWFGHSIEGYASNIPAGPERPDIRLAV